MRGPGLRAALLLLAGCASTHDASAPSRCDGEPPHACSPSSAPAVPDAASSDAPAWPASAFVGRWTLVSGSGASQCGDGPVEAQPVSTDEVCEIAQTGSDTLTWSEPGGCQGVPLQFQGDDASLAAAGYECSTASGGASFDVTFSRFALTLGAAAEGGASPGDDASDGPIPPRMTVDLVDSVPVNGADCTLTAHYVLERAP